MAVHVALIEPRIPPNTGNIARLCAATDTPLHLIEPLGFSLDEREVRRAGLDYWDRVDLWVHPGWRAFREAIARERCLYFSANATREYRDAPFRANSCLVFGNETDGMPARILEKHPQRCFRIPMPGDVRSLNLANAVSIVLYEALGRVPADPLRRTEERRHAAADDSGPDDADDRLGAAERVRAAADEPGPDDADGLLPEAPAPG